MKKSKIVLLTSIILIILLPFLLFNFGRTKLEVSKNDINDFANFFTETQNYESSFGDKQNFNKRMFFFIENNPLRDYEINSDTYINGSWSISLEDDKTYAKIEDGGFISNDSPSVWMNTCILRKYINEGSIDEIPGLGCEDGTSSETIDDIIYITDEEVQLVFSKSDFFNEMVLGYDVFSNLNKENHKVYSRKVFDIDLLLHSNYLYYKYTYVETRKKLYYKDNLIKNFRLSKSFSDEGPKGDDYSSGDWEIIFEDSSITNKRLMWGLGGEGEDLEEYREFKNNNID